MPNPFLEGFVKDAGNRYNIDRDSMSHGDWMCANTKLQGKPFSFKRYPFQKAIADDMHDNLDCIKPSQVGLALDLNTPVPTPNGWSTMGALEVGDWVYDEKGQPCRVEYVSPTYTDHPCFAVTFDTGETIVADANHRWYVECDKAFNAHGMYPGRGRIPVDSDYARTGVLNTETLSQVYSSGKRNHFAIPNTEPLAGHQYELPIDPYLMGLWLGDGNTASMTLTTHQEDMPTYQRELERRGYDVVVRNLKGVTLQFSAVQRNGVKRHRTDVLPEGQWREDTTLYGRLVTMDLIRNKHIPEIYLRANAESRLDLLRGLMDTDGTVTKRGRASFYNCNQELVAGVQELIHSLGFKARTRWREPAGGVLKNGHRIESKQPVAEVSFVAYQDSNPFLLPRKAERVLDREQGRSSESLRRRIVDIQPVETRPVRCISVSSESHLFLAGRGMIPTHNTEVQIRKALAILKRTPGLSLIFTLPNEKMYKRISKARIQPLLDDRAFRNPDAGGTKQAMSLMKIGSSWLYVTGAAEADATSINADIVFNDEIDLTPQDMLALFNSRLQGSDLRINQRFSTPTYEGYGVHKGFSVSDQMHYLIKCQACGHHQDPVFSRDFIHIPGLPEEVQDLLDLDQQLLDEGVISLDGCHVKCEKCGKPLDLGDHDQREWVAKYPSRSSFARGYQVRPFSTERLDVRYILTQLFRYKARDNLKGFCNTVLGEVDKNGENRLTEKVLELCFQLSSAVPPVQEDKCYWLGIDVGQVCNLVLAVGDSMEKFDIVRWDTCKADELAGLVDQLFKRYRIVGGGIDRHPYTPTADAIRNQTNGVIMPMEYRGSKEVAEVKDATGVVSHLQINRTLALDYIANAIKKARVSFTGYGNQKTLIIEHFRDMVRESPEEGEAVWRKLNGKDHYFHACAFLMGAMCYHGVQLANQDYQHVGLGFDNLSPYGFGSGLILPGYQAGGGNLFGDEWAAAKNGKIITRHRG